MAWSESLLKKTWELLTQGGIAGTGAFMKNLNGRHGIFPGGKEGQYAIYLLMEKNAGGKNCGSPPEIFASVDALIDAGWAVD
jgi:hypothetical protein